jgi:hypothetical protein
MQKKPLSSKRQLKFPYTETTLEQLIVCVGYKGPKKTLKQMEKAIVQGAKLENLFIVPRN